MTGDILRLLGAIGDIWLTLAVGWHIFLSRNPHDWNRP